jgi:acyl-coenzyme A thioesterase PaaI-like protein
MTFMDQAVSMIAWSEADRQPSATVQLDAHFLAPAKAGEFVVARVQVTRKSASLIFLRGTLCVEDREIMTAQGLMKIVRRSAD